MSRKNKVDKFNYHNEEVDWSLYTNGFVGGNKLVRNPSVKTKGKDKVYCHEDYAQELYDLYTGEKSLDNISAKDQISGNSYSIKEVNVVSNHEILIEADNGMSAVIDLNKEHRFLHNIGYDNVKQFVDSISHSEDIKQQFLDLNMKAVAVDKKRVSLWEGMKKGMEKEMYDDLMSDGGPRWAYDAKVISTVSNGGFNVEINGLPCFLPGSLAAAGPVQDFDSLIGTTIRVCAVNYSPQARSFVVSHKKYLEMVMPGRVRNELFVGQSVHVKVTGSSKNGVFCAIRDEHGDYSFQSLMHRTTMSPDFESMLDCGDFKIGDEFNAYIHKINWIDDKQYRIVVGDQAVPIEKESDEDED